MEYRRPVIAGLTAIALTFAVAGCGGSSPESPSTTEHDMSEMQPGETMPHDMNDMKPGETMPHDMSNMKPGETMPPGY